MPPAGAFRKTPARLYIWYHRAADLGYPPAQYNLARALYDGDGVPLARADSATWCRRAADQHHATAQYTLGWLYEDGDGVPQDYREAATWYTHAAAQGHPKAQFNLALMLDSGRGVTRNHDEAGRWYSLAAGQGHQAAQGMIDRLAVRYPPGPFEPYEPSSTERVLSELARNRATDAYRMAHQAARRAERTLDRADDILDRIFAAARVLDRHESSRSSAYSRLYTTITNLDRTADRTNHRLQEIIKALKTRDKEMRAIEARWRQTMLNRIAEPPDGPAEAGPPNGTLTVADVKNHPADPDGEPDTTRGTRRW